jgi:uncharacterized protein YlzI (FlbEa/FlbD family)
VIKLTCLNGKDVYLNVSTIVSFSSAGDGSITMVLTVLEKVHYLVKESPTQTRDLINGTRKI